MLTLLMLASPAVTATEEGELKVEHGNLQVLCKGSTIQQGDITFLPIRDVFGAYNVQVAWAEDEAEEKIIITTGAGRYQLVVNLDESKAMGVNNKTYDIRNVNHKVYLPVNFYADVMNCEVLWDGATNTLMIDQKPTTDNVAVEKEESTNSGKKIVNLPAYEKTTVSRSMGPTLVYYDQGLASWYGGQFQGRKTSSGAVYNMNDYTAAHRTLPFGTVVRVTAMYNGQSVDVTINDRGPFIAGRVIDISRAAADQIGLISKGVGAVRLEIIR